MINERKTNTTTHRPRSNPVGSCFKNRGYMKPCQESNPIGFDLQNKDVVKIYNFSLKSKAIYANKNKIHEELTIETLQKLRISHEG